MSQWEQKDAPNNECISWELAKMKQEPINLRKAEISQTSLKFWGSAKTKGGVRNVLK